MGEFYNPYQKLPKNIRQIGDRDLNVKLFVEDYVNTYLKRLYPAGGKSLRVGPLLGESKTQDGTPYLFVDGALEMEEISQDKEQMEFTEEAWIKAYQTIDQMFPRRAVLGWFLCSTPEHSLSPLNYWKQHNRYFPAKNQLMYLSCGLEGEEALYVASDDGFYKLRGYNIFYERNQMMQDYMVSRKDAHRVETLSRDAVIRDFRQKMVDNKEEARRQNSTLNSLRTACGVLSILVLACGVAMLNNYHKMRDMESVIVSALPEDAIQNWPEFLGTGEETDPGYEMVFEEVPGEVYPTPADIVIQPESFPETQAPSEDGQAETVAEKAVQADIAQEETPQMEAGSTQETAATEPAPQTDGNENAGNGGLLAEAAEETTGQAPEAQPVQVPADAVIYTVQEGETLYGICLARYHSVNDLDKICQWNQLEDQNQLFIGQQIYVPPVGDGQ